MNLLYETKISYKKGTLGWTCYTTRSSKNMAFVVYFGWNIIVKLIWAEKICSSKAVRASPMVLSMWSCNIKLDEAKSKYAGLAQEIGFGWA
jgi:hypothetical protein